MSDAAARAGAVLTIDLAAVVENWRRLNARLKPGTKAMAVVKADAYGLGAAQVAPALAKAGCTRFAVATLDEGIALRGVLPDAEILVFAGPFARTEDDYDAHRLVPVLNSREQIARWSAYADRVERKLPAVVHIDTGLSRLGLSDAEARVFAIDRRAHDAFDLMMVMSHLAIAEEPEHPLNQKQFDRFAAIRRLFPETPASLSASSGLFLGPDWQADWVRPGAALYGVNPTPYQATPMAQIIHLKGRIVQVRDIDPGETVGYGATWRAPEQTKLAVVAAGYADGLLRALSNRGGAVVGENRVPLVGRVSMDLMVFDVGGLLPGAAVPGGFVTLIGPGNDIDQVAEAAGTNGYEMLTSLGGRYHRVWQGS
ncbi:MAG TPA: alanine racemase [Magnetospirillaceae bacterium]|jgi:alanine racemase